MLVTCDITCLDYLKKFLISQSIMWAAAILVVSIVDEKQFAVLMLVILATVSLMNLRKEK